MNRKRKHHYLPVSYLDGFCGVGNRVWTYPRDSYQNPYANPPSSTANERDLYRLTGNDIDEERIENYFATEIEGPAIKALKRLRNMKIPDDDEKAQLSLFFAALVVRSPNFIKQLEGKYSGLIRKMAVDSAEHKSDFYFQYKKMNPGMTEMEIEQDRQSMILQDEYELNINRNVPVVFILTIMRMLSQIIYNLKWCLLVTNDKLPFITSDNLASCMNLDISSYGSSQVLEVVNYIPISSELCLQFHKDERFREYEVISINDGNETIFSNINQITFLGSHKYVFACADSEILKKTFKDILL